MASVTECPSCGNTYSRIGQHWSISECSAPPIPDDLMDIATGVVMGDGTVSNRDKKPYIEVRTVTKEYAQYLDRLFGIFSSGFKNTGKQSSSFTDSDIYRWATRTHEDFTVFDSWYTDEGKVFPDELSVDDGILREWYVCDGSYNRGRMVLTAENERDRIEDVAELVEYETSTTGNQIVVPKSESSKFFDSTDPVPGFRYKWP